MSEDIKIRKLKRKDRVVLASMIKKLAEKIGSNKLLNMIVADVSATETKESDEKSESQFIQVGVELLRTMIDTLEEEAAAWFADLCSVTPEAFDDLPFDIEIQIINQIAESEEAANFFTGASHLYSKIKGYAGPLQTGKTP